MYNRTPFDLRVFIICFPGTLVPGGSGGGADWLQEHIRTGYLPAWSNPIPTQPVPGVPNPDPSEGPYVCCSDTSL